MWDIYEISIEYSKNIYILDIFLVIIWEFRYIFSYISEYWDISLKTQLIFYRLSHRYTISRDISVKAWQKGYPRDILYQLGGWLIKNSIYRPISRVGWEAYNPYQPISFRPLYVYIWRDLSKDSLLTYSYRISIIEDINNKYTLVRELTITSYIALKDSNHHIVIINNVYLIN